MDLGSRDSSFLGLTRAVTRLPAAHSKFTGVPSLLRRTSRLDLLDFVSSPTSIYFVRCAGSSPFCCESQRLWRRETSRHRYCGSTTQLWKHAADSPLGAARLIRFMKVDPSAPTAFNHVGVKHLRSTLRTNCNPPYPSSFSVCITILLKVNTRSAI